MSGTRRWHSHVFQVQRGQCWHDVTLKALGGRRAVKTDQFNLRVVSEEGRKIVGLNGAFQNIAIETAGSFTAADHVPNGDSGLIHLQDSVGV
ncbi:MAG: hypothetical protein JWP89_5292 [Schlesneria sp.]|nr:hypothetical protein [Schlesneria sp.]